MKNLLIALAIASMIATPIYAKPPKAPPVDPAFSASYKAPKAPPIDPTFSDGSLASIDETDGSVVTTRKTPIAPEIVKIVRPAKAPPIVDFDAPVVMETPPTPKLEPALPPFGLPMAAPTVKISVPSKPVATSVAAGKMKAAGVQLVTKEEAVACDTCPAGYFLTGKTFTTAEPVATTATTMACGNPDCTCEPGECPCPAGACPCGPVSSAPACVNGVCTLPRAAAPAVTCASGNCGPAMSCASGTCGPVTYYGEPTPAPLWTAPPSYGSACGSCGPVSGPTHSVLAPRPVMGGFIQRLVNRVRGGR